MVTPRILTDASQKIPDGDDGTTNGRFHLGSKMIFDFVRLSARLFVLAHVSPWWRGCYHLSQLEIGIVSIPRCSTFELLTVQLSLGAVHFVILLV